MWRVNNNAGGIKCTVDTYCAYETQEEGVQALTKLLSTYVNTYGFDYRAIRKRYSGMGEVDYLTFMQIFNEEYQHRR